MKFNLSKENLSRIINESIKKVKKINEGSTVDWVTDVYFDVFDDMSGHEVASILYNYLDEDSLTKIAEWLIKDEYIEDPREGAVEDEFLEL